MEILHDKMTEVRIFFKISNLQIWHFTAICCNRFLNLFYWQAYISGISNECDNNLSSKQDGDSTKFQKVDVESNVQLIQTFVIKENKRSYSVTTVKQERKKIQIIL